MNPIDPINPVSDEDVEGHMPALRRGEDAPKADDDTEGHIARVKDAPKPDAEDDEDTEGHASRGKV